MPPFIRPGLLVRTPGSGLFGNRPAIVEQVSSSGVEVHTGTALLTYELSALTPLATIAITTRSYRTPGGNRFRVCLLCPVDPQYPRREYHVQVGAAGEAAETRAQEIRKLVFLQLRHEAAWPFAQKEP